MFGYELLLMTFIFCIMLFIIVLSIVILIGFGSKLIIDKIFEFLEGKSEENN